MYDDKLFFFDKGGRNSLDDNMIQHDYYNRFTIDVHLDYIQWENKCLPCENDCGHKKETQNECYVMGYYIFNKKASECGGRSEKSGRVYGITNMKNKNACNHEKKGSRSDS